MQPIAYPKAAGTPLLDRPDGDVLVRLSAQTVLGTDRGLSVVAERGGWIGVIVEELENGQVGWMERSEAQVGTMPWKLVADLSRRELTLERAGEVRLRIPVGVGGAESPTPIGRFAVSDELVQPVLGGSGEYGLLCPCPHRAPVQPASRLERRGPAGHPRHERGLVDRTGSVCGVP